ncbi:putative cyclase protein [Corchorus olitorius]|uniref:Cyclase protein n=1 Tax=Corchorus olitorius TaxID=93759 RepID=A0A1R3GYW6_9ROSI|nr:putative cyclase protein [Corchorus olitorius]
MTKTMSPLPLLHLFLLVSTAITATASSSAYPSVPTDCTLSTGDEKLIPIRREVYGDGRIFDISHRYTTNMPSWGSNDGIGQFLWLPASMKNGSLANNSEMKMPTHTGTHVDAPGHMIDRYFDAGFDVDTLDLEVLNGPALLVDVPRNNNITAEVMESLAIPKGVRRVLFRTLNTDRGLMYKKEYDTSYVGFTTDGARWLVKNTDIKLVADDHLVSAHLEFFESREFTTYSGGAKIKTDQSPREGDEILKPIRREVYGDGRIFDISHRYTPDMPSWESEDGVGEFLSLPKSMKNGSLANNSEMKLPTHTGTHLDAPGHVYDRYFDAGFDVDTLDLEVLNGPALLVDVPRDKNITAEVMESLKIPKGVRRVLFRTLNTDRRLMFKKEFDTSYVGFMKDGAEWLVKNTDIKLVGIDYLSVAAFDDLIPSHLVFLEGREIILVEGLKLDDIQPGIYSVHCLPLRLLGAEGSPIVLKFEILSGLDIIFSSAALAYGKGKIFDITHKITSDLPIFNSKNGLGKFIWLVSSIKNGSMANESQFKLGTHTGTHVDAPSHFYQKYYEEGFDVTTLSLEKLNGPALVVNVPRDKNITAEVMKSLKIPRGIHRVLFKTLNTDRGLMHKTEFASDFTGFMKDGAQWLVDNTDIKLVGLNLDGIQPGKYTVHCLPLRMVGADGVPTRCILTA